MDRQDRINKVDTKKALFGLFFSFGNLLQQAGDIFYEEISAKQFFLLICLSLFETPPTLNELCEVMQCSHQNAKQIALKLEKLEFVKFIQDKEDKRKVRIMLTDKMLSFSKKYEKKEIEFMDHLYQGIDDEQIEATFKTMLGIENNLIKIKENTHE